MRPTRVQTFMEIAHVWAKRSTCHRLNVGAVIVHERRIISHGYNGAPSGHAHCSGNDCPGKFVCRETIHAERNAIEHMPRVAHEQDGTGNDLKDLDMFTTDSPCPSCAELILKHPIRRVFFSTPYRITDALDALIERGVDVYRVTPAGWVIDWETKDVVELEI